MSGQVPQCQGIVGFNCRVLRAGNSYFITYVPRGDLQCSATIEQLHSTDDSKLEIENCDFYCPDS